MNIVSSENGRSNSEERKMLTIANRPIYSTFGKKPVNMSKVDYNDNQTKSPKIEILSTDNSCKEQNQTSEPNIDHLLEQRELSTNKFESAIANKFNKTPELVNELTKTKDIPQIQKLKITGKTTNVQEFAAKQQDTRTSVPSSTSGDCNSKDGGLHRKLKSAK